MTEDSNTSEFSRLLDHLKKSRGFDFSAYKVSSLMRRIQKRMREVGVESYAAYSDYLEVHPHEFGPLFDTVLINVTAFFRDPPAWDFVANTLLPRIRADKGEAPIRVWSAGCASGEEAYTLAMLLVEAFGEEEFKQRIKIYATDADEGALATARLGSFESRHTAGIPPEMCEKYFEAAGTRYVFRPDLRRCMIFGRHDLIQDAAISRLDLLVCRNALMYFNAETQEKILARFHFALNKSGYLFLGKAETLLTHNNSFKPVDLRHRIFARSSTSNMRERLLALTPPGNVTDVSGARHLRVQEAALDASPLAQIAVDRRGFLVLANQSARQLFNLSVNDPGRLLQDLELSYRPVELRSHLEAAYESRVPVHIQDVEWRGAGDSRLFEVQVIPLIDARGAVLGASVAFLDLTRTHQLRTELERSSQELETAYEELQSSNEELETTNEELQSANEELETMNEELQSTNEELRTLNDQLLSRSEELYQVNGYFDSVLTSLRAAVVVLDRRLHVRVWNQRAEELWGLRRGEVEGQDFLGLDFGLPVEELREPLLGSLGDGGRDVAIDGVNRRGRKIRCRVRSMPVSGRTGAEGLVLLMEETERE